MKFNLSDFLQLDTKELLAVNGGSPCSGPTTGPSNNASDPTSPSYGSGGNDGNGGGSSGPGAGASGSGGGGCSPSNNPSKPGGPKNPENNKPGNNSDAGSGGGACSPTNSKAPDTGNPDSSNPDNNIRSGGGECSAQEPKTYEIHDDKYGTSIRVTIYPDGHGTREFIDTKTGEVISSGPIGPYDSGKNDNSTKSTSSEANTNSGRTESGTGASSVGNDGTKGTQDSPSTHESEGSGSHNSNGQGSSTTSSNPGGTSGTTSDSTKNNGSNNNNGSNTDVSNDTDKVSGMFGQITDGTYADRLTMQYYINQHTADGDVTDKIMNDTKGENNEIIEAHSFSTDGCLMTVCAKIASEKLGRNVQLIEINNLFDKNSDGLLSYEEIEQGFIDILGEDYNIEADYFTEGRELNKNQFINAAQKGDTYVLARAYGDFDENGTFEHHWVVLEGYTTDADGRMIFSYDGTSDNDAKYNRVYVYGDPKSKNEFKIDKIETFRITNK